MKVTRLMFAALFLCLGLNPGKLIASQPEADIFKGKTFSPDWFSHNIEHLKQYIPLFNGKKIRGLEIGSFEGRSTLWMASYFCNAPGSTLEALDTWSGSAEHQGQPYLVGLYEKFISNLKEHIDLGRVIPVKGPSNLTLMRFNLEMIEGNRESYDFIYVDGAHDARSVAKDAILSWDLLKKGGILIFDDYRWKGESDEPEVPKSAVDFFLHAYIGQYKLLHNAYQLAVEKL